VIHKGYHPWAATKKWEAYLNLNMMIVFLDGIILQRYRPEIYKLYIFLVSIYQVKQSRYTFIENLQSINKKPLSNISAD